MSYFNQAVKALQCRIIPNEIFLLMKQGLLLVNLGTPDSPGTKDVRRYLKEFLTDPRVIDIPTPIRLILLYAFILPFRPRQSAQAYQSIWRNDGSPLLIHSIQLKKRLQQTLSNQFKVALGMRYGNPTIELALSELKDCQSITVLPLFPQYSSAATGSAIEAVLDVIKTYQTQPNLRIIRDFYNHPGFIQSMAAQIRPYLDDHQHVLFSYHGLPERQIIKGGCDKICVDNCPIPENKQPACYRAQCYATSAALSETLALQANRYSTAFQSRLGRTPWIQPYTDEILPIFIKRGIKNLLVACPSFTVDCLETLEEIGIRAKEQWLKSGGTKLTLVPCVNDHSMWIKGIQDIISS